MSEPVRWVTKAEAAQELKISLSTLDRKITKGDVEIVWEGRRVYVRMHGPQYLSDGELLRRAIYRVDELERTVRELERNLSESEHRTSELECERDEAREAAATARRPYLELEWTHEKEVTEHKATMVALSIVGVIVVVLIVVCGLLTWQLVT